VSGRLAGVLMGTALAVLGVIALEWRLAARGVETTVLDSADLWARERERASALSERALIVIGASRIQLGLDLDVLRAELGYEPVQLAIDGGEFPAVLQDLAHDTRVRGAVLIDFMPSHVLSGASSSNVRAALRAYHERVGRPRWNSAAIEAELDFAVRTRLRAYADGAQPLQSLLNRALGDYAKPQYLITYPDRARAADYAAVHMPEFYYMRVARELGRTELVETAPDEATAQTRLRAVIDALAPADDLAFAQHWSAVARDIATLRARGARVALLAMPTAGLVTEIEDKRFPRARFWQHAMAHAQADAVHWQDVPGLSAFETPDGSHLDRRDRAAFTRALAAALRARWALPAR
jgi:hypothetical protein